MQVYFKDAYCPCFTSAHQRHWATQHHCGKAHELLSWRSLGMLKARSMVRQTDEASHYMIQPFGRADIAMDSPQNLQVFMPFIRHVFVLSADGTAG